MAGFATVADLTEALSVPRIQTRFTKSAPGSGVANGMSSYWLSAGSTSWPAGAAPGSTAMVAPTRSTAGALQFPLASSAAKVRHIGRTLMGGSSAAHAWELFDRLLHGDGLAATSTAVQAVGGAAVPARGADDIHEMYLEFYAATGAATGNVSVVYVNQAGATKTAPPVAVPASVGIGRMIAVPFAAGDYQVQTVTSCQGDTNLLSGSYGVTVVRRLGLALFDRSIPRSVPQDAFFCGLPKVPDDACLALALGFGSSASVLSCGGSIWFPEADAA
jgi:hypothetical protein